MPKGKKRPSLKPPALKELGLEEEDPETVFDVHGRKGTGAFGAVFRATYKNDAFKTVAIKIIQIALQAGQHGEDIENVRKEIQFLRECDHPNVTKFFNAYYKDGSLWIVMEYCGGGSVGDIARQRKLSSMEIAVIMRESLKGLAYLHEKHKIHRDIKGGNILLTEEGQVKIADFGVSAQLRDTMSRRGTFVGTPYWMSPEMIQDSEYDYKADIWSLGITAIELAEQKPPLFDEHPMRVLLRIPRNPPPNLRNQAEWDEHFSQFLEFCLVKDPNKRPSADESLQHPFIAKTSHIQGVMCTGIFVLHERNIQDTDEVKEDVVEDDIDEENEIEEDILGESDDITELEEIEIEESIIIQSSAEDPELLKVEKLMVENVSKEDCSISHESINTLNRSTENESHHPRSTERTAADNISQTETCSSIGSIAKSPQTLTVNTNEAPQSKKETNNVILRPASPGSPCCIGAPQSVYHVTNVKFDTQTAQYVGVPATNSWKAFHQQFGLPVRDIPCRPDLSSPPQSPSKGNRVPALLRMLKRELLKRDGLLAEGIFRVAADSQLLRKAKSEIDSGKFQSENYSDAHIYSCLIKVWLRDLPHALLEPIGMSGMSRLGAVASGLIGTDDECRFSNNEIEDVLSVIPVLERQILDWLLEMLVQVIEQSERNRMTAESLSIVFGPNLYRVNASSTDDALRQSTTVTNGVRALIHWAECHEKLKQIEIGSQFRESSLTSVDLQQDRKTKRMSKLTNSKSAADFIQQRVDAYFSEILETIASMEKGGENGSMDEMLKSQFHYFQDLVFNTIEEWGNTSENAWAECMRSLTMSNEDGYCNKQIPGIPISLQLSVSRWINAAVGYKDFLQMIKDQQEASSRLLQLRENILTLNSTTKLLSPTTCDRLWYSVSPPEPFFSSDEPQNSTIDQLDIDVSPDMLKLMHRGISCLQDRNITASMEDSITQCVAEPTCANILCGLGAESEYLDARSLEEKLILEDIVTKSLSAA